MPTTTTPTISDIERAACTIVAQAPPVHPVLRAWTERVVSDPNYDRYFSEYEPDAEQLANVRQDGYYEVGENQKNLDEIISNGRFYQSSELNYSERERRYHVARSMATHELANDIVHHRRIERPHGDVQSEIRYGDSAIAGVSSSLAANIAEYVAEITNLAARLLHMLEAAEKPSK